MKKPRKRRAKSRRQINPGRAPVVHNNATVRSKIVPRVSLFNSRVRSFFDLDEERQAFALLMAPFFIMAFAIAINASIQTDYQISRVVPEYLIASNEIGGVSVLRDDRSVVVVDPSTAELVDAVAWERRVSAFDAHAFIHPDMSGETISNINGSVGSKGDAVQARDLPGVRVLHASSSEKISPSIEFDKALASSVMGERVLEATHFGAVQTVTKVLGKQLASVPPLRITDTVGTARRDAVSLAQSPLAEPLSAQLAGVQLQSRSYGSVISVPHMRAVDLSPIETAPIVRPGFAISALALTAVFNGDVRDITPEQNMCVAKANSFQHVRDMANPMSGAKDQFGFGVALARAAKRQTDDFVIYNDKYMSIGFPMGDVPTLYGVCTDVVIRAYRALGYDLQDLVYRSRIGRGDRSINHRRTQTLRSFFHRFGESVPITPYPEDYLPGDIVTYHRPQNRGSQMHIGIVGDVVAPSGRPMLIHNRGWGPQMEDALFVDQITGHYRYFGPKKVLSSAVASGPVLEHVSRQP